MPTRYNRNTILSNDTEFYAPLRSTRDLKIIRHYPTQLIRNPVLADRMAVITNSHMWKYGNRFYNLAHTYYGDRRYWWVIAWWNGVPTESHIKLGDIIEIPVNIEDALKVLNV